MFSRGLSEYKPVSVFGAPSSEIRTFLKGRLLNIGDVGKLGLHLTLGHIQACLIDMELLPRNVFISKVPLEDFVKFKQLLITFYCI